MRSPGPQWVAFQEPAASSTEDEPESDGYPLESTTLKRKGKVPVSQPIHKRPKLASEPARREPTTGEGSRGESSKTPTLSHHAKPKSIQLPTGRVGSIAGPSKPISGKEKDASKRPNVTSDEPRQSLLKFRPIDTSSTAKTKVIKRRMGKFKETSSEESGMDVASPPASPSPPAESSTKPRKKFHTSQMPESERQSHGTTKPRKPSANPGAQPTHPRRSLPSSTEVIEISSSEDSPPKPKASSSKLSRPPPSKRQSLPAFPKNHEIIVIDDSDEEMPVLPSRSAPPISENTASHSTTRVAHPVTPPPDRHIPTVKSSPLSNAAEERLLSDRSPPALKTERPPKAIGGDDPKISSSNSFQSRRPEHSSQRPPSVDLRLLSGNIPSPRGSKTGNSSTPGSPLASAPFIKPAFPRKPSLLRPNSSSSVDDSHDKPDRPVANRNDSLDLDIRGLKVADVSSSPSLPPPPTKVPGSSSSAVIPGRQNPGKAKARRSLSSSSTTLVQASTSSGNSASSTPPVKSTKSKQAPSEGTASAILKDVRPALSQPAQTLAEAITQASESNARRGSSKQDAIDLTSDTLADSDMAPPLYDSLDGAIASSQFLKSLTESGDLEKTSGSSSMPSTPTIPKAVADQAEPLQRATPARRPLAGRSHTSPSKGSSISLDSVQAPTKSAKSENPTHPPSASTSRPVYTRTPKSLETGDLSTAVQIPTSPTRPIHNPIKPTTLPQVQPATTSSLVTSPVALRSPLSPSTNTTATATWPTRQESPQTSEEPTSDAQPEHLDEPALTSQDSDSDEMDVVGLPTTTPAITKLQPSASQLFDDEADELVVATSSLAVASASGSSPDPLDMRVSSSPEQPTPSSGSPSDKPRRSSRNSSVTSNDPLSLFAEDELETPPKTRSASPYDSSKVVATKTFGGFPSLNWKTFRQDVSNFTQKCYLAKDLPHSLQDHINCWSPIGQRFPGLRTVLECYIQENTADDEPDAPLIEIINTVDDDPTPPWEFHYSNKMWHGEGVPPPDVSRLTSCGCTGKCDPKSKTCACLKRQQHYTGEADFAFDPKGRLKLIDYPIFECNDLCGCDEECRNRVVQHGRKCPVSIKKTVEKGWGVFAGPKKIYQGTFVGIYAGELLTDEVGEERGFKYNKFGRTYLFDLDFHHLKEGNDTWEVKYTVDAYHAGNFTRFLNHSCDPNCRLVPCYINESNLEKPLLTVFTRRDIEPFEELCFSYSGDYPEDDDDDDELDPRSSPSADREDQVYAKCACRAKNCTGVMFK